MNFIFTPQKWASSNVRSARLLIFLLCFFSGVFFFELGLWLPEMNKYQSILLWSATVGTMYLCYKYYYSGRGRLYKRIVMNMGLILLWMHLGNQVISIMPSGQNELAPLKEASVIYPVKPLAETDKNIRSVFKKYLSKRKGTLSKKLGKIETMTPIGAFFLFFLLGLLALVISFYLAVYSCALSCNGQMTLSYVVLASAAIFALGGLFLIAYAIFRAVKGRNATKDL
jgi:hypothetical protein